MVVPQETDLKIGSLESTMELADYTSKFHFHFSFLSFAQIPDFIKLFSNSDQSAPFTLQRITELILAGEQHYGSTRKLLNALEKVLDSGALDCNQFYLS